MIDITNDMDKILATENAVVYFTAAWCQPCKQLKPLYAKAGMQDDNYNYFVVDVDAIDADHLKRYNVQSVPSVFKMKNGDIQKVITARTADEIIQQVNS